jgi:hypothetical protein
VVGDRSEREVVEEWHFIRGIAGAKEVVKALFISF